jgi:hypothetical protein
MIRLIRGSIFLAILALCLALPCTGGRLTFAQSAPNDQTPDEEELDAQRRAAGVQILQNLFAQGVNPAEFFAEVFSGMPEGGFDGDFFRQKLIEHNLVDQDTLDHIDSTVQRVAGTRMQHDLGVTGTEWDALRSKIQKVLDTGFVAGVQLPKGSVLGLRPKVKGKTEVQIALSAVEAASNDPNASPKEINEKLAAWRAAKKKAMADYVDAQKQLIAVCTQRQEAFFTAIGLVE